jgi:hypothetical protein
MNCRTCGAPLPPEAKMCPNCGTPVSASTFHPGESPYGSGTVPYPYGSQSSSSPSYDATVPAYPSNTPGQGPATGYGANAYPPAPDQQSPYAVPLGGQQNQQSPYAVPSAGQQIPYGAPPPLYGSQQAGAYPPSYPPPFPPASPQAQKQARRFPIWLAVLLILLVLLLIGGSGLIYYAAVYQPNLVHTHATATTIVHQTGTAQAQATVQAQLNATATAAAQNPYTRTGTLMFSDPLSDNSKNHHWDVDPNCDFKGGTYHAIAPNPKYGDYCIAQATDLVNFTLEVQMQVIQGDGGGVNFRVTNTTVNEYYDFYIFRSGAYGLEMVGGTSKSLASGSNAPVKPNLNDVNVIGIVAQGSTITVYLNHQQLASANDSTYTRGRIGVEANTYANGGQATEVAYSNMKVWGA